jgi:hypothetical protein
VHPSRWKQEIKNDEAKFYTQYSYGSTAKYIACEMRDYLFGRLIDFTKTGYFETYHRWLKKRNAAVLIQSAFRHFAAIKRFKQMSNKKLVSNKRRKHSHAIK